MLSAAQLASRREGITGTDIAAIIGVSPYRSAIDVWLDKTGQAPPFVGNVATQWGNALEPLLRADYEQRHRMRVEVPGTLTHPTKSWWKGSPDGICYASGDTTPQRGIELKVHNDRALWWLGYGDPGTDEVPPHELTQALWYMPLIGVERMDLVCFNGAPIEYVIERDDELLAMLEERAERFLVDNVRAGVPPEPDGSKSYDAWIASRFKARNAAASMLDVTADVTVRTAIDRLREVRGFLTTYEAEESKLEQALKLVIGDHAGITFPGDRKAAQITYKQAKDSPSADYEAIAAEIRTTLGLVASGCDSDVKRAIVALDKMAEQHFANARATITAAEIRALIVKLHDAAANAASAKIVDAHTKTMPGSRRFCVPRDWK